MSQTANEFKRPDKILVEQYRKVAKCYSASCVFADVQRRRGVMYSSIKPIFNGTLVGPAVTVKLSTSDLQDCLNAQPLAQAEREEATRKAIAAGKTVEDLLEEFGRI